MDQKEFDKNSCLALKQYLEYLVEHPQVANKHISNIPSETSYIPGTKNYFPYFKTFYCGCNEVQNFISENKIKIKCNSDYVSYVMPTKNGGEIEYDLVDAATYSLSKLKMKCK